MSFQIIWNGIQHFAKNMCPTQCEIIDYDIRLSKLAKNSVSNSLIKKTMFFVSYATTKVKIEEEYTLMGTNAIISATGGSLGLFLGFSCYGAIWNVFEMLKKAANSIFSSNMKKAKAGNGRRRR